MMAVKVKFGGYHQQATIIAFFFDSHMAAIFFDKATT